MVDRDDPRRWEWAVENTRLGVWDCDLITGETVFNERWAEILGRDLSELEPKRLILGACSHTRKICSGRTLRSQTIWLGNLISTM
jgi:PAS domain-containing protein